MDSTKLKAYQLKEPPYSGRLTRQEDDTTLYVGATIMGVLFMVFIFVSEVFL